MREILFREWIPKKMELCKGGQFQIKGTGIWEDECTHRGMFHQWANAMEEGRDNFGNYTVALVELPDGTIKEILPSNIKFIENIHENQEL